MGKFMTIKLTEKVAIPLLFQIAQYFSFLKQYRLKSIKLLNNRRELALLTNDDKLFIVYYVQNYGWVRYQEYEKDFIERESFECNGDNCYVAGTLSDFIHQHLEIEKEYHSP